MKNTTIISKTIKYTFSLILSLALIFSTVSFGAETEGFINASYNAQKCAVSVTSSGLLPGGEAVIIHVVPFDTPLEEGGLPTVSDMFISSTDGLLSSEILLPEDFANGKYIVYVTWASMEEAYKTDMLIFSEESTATKDAFKAVASASQKSDFKKAVENGGFDLGIDVNSEKDFNAMTDVMYGVFENSDSYSFDIFSKSIDYGRAAVMIKSGESIDSVMQKYAYTFEISYSEYSSLKANVKSELNKLISNIDVLGGFVYYDNLLAVATVKSADGYGSVRDYVLANISIVDIDIEGDYSELSVNDQSKVFKNVYENRNSFKTVEDIKKAFNKAVADIKNQASQSSQGSSGSSSSSKGSGSSFGSTSYSEPITSVPTVVTPPVETPVAKDIYSDISNHFAKEYIQTLSANGVLSGFEDGSFRPNECVTRAQVAKIITLAFGIDESGEASFDDTDSSSWYSSYVCSLASKGIVKGDNNKFRPNDFITREDAAVIIVRALGFKGTKYNGEYTFADADQISPYAKDAVNALASNGFLKGDGVSFMPKNSITRGELAAIIGRLTDNNK